MPDEYFLDSTKTKMVSRTTKTGEDVEKAKATEKLTTVAGTGLGAKAKGGRKPMPKQSDYPGNTDGWREAVRKWRVDESENPSNDAAKRALKRLGEKP